MGRKLEFDLLAEPDMLVMRARLASLDLDTLRASRRALSVAAVVEDTVWSPLIDDELERRSLSAPGEGSGAAGE